MKLTNRWSRTATACAAGALVLGLGTVAAQSQGDFWWHNIFDTGPAFGHSVQGEVTISIGGPGPFDSMSGNLGRARASFPQTGEYIGCQVTTDFMDGQTLTCAARDAEGNDFQCITQFTPGGFAMREHMLLNAALNLTDSHYLVVNVDPDTQECVSLQVMASSADFLAEGGSPTPGNCSSTNSVDLGPFGGSPVTVATNACVKVTAFASWPYGPNRTMQVQNPSGNSYPVPFTYQQSCTGANGSGQFDHNYDDQFLPGMSDACPLFIKLQGSPTGTIALRYW